jgi:hypothetical protein
MTARRIVQVIIAGFLVTCIFAYCPLSADAAAKKGGGTNVQSNSAKRGTGNSLSNAGTAGATKGAGGGVPHSPNCSVNCGPAVNNGSGKGGGGGGGGPGSGGSPSTSP